MKKPRIDAFITPEKARALTSSLDGMPAIRPPVVQPTQGNVPEPSKVGAEAHESQHGVPPYPHRAVPRTPVPLSKRQIVERRPFDIYLDQYNRLKEIAREETNSGGTGSMSRMVREAIDAYLAVYDLQRKKQ
jgi:hypothetical protein